MNSLSIPPETDILHNEMLTVKEVAAYLRVDRVTVWRWCKTGFIPASHIGHHWRIHRADLLRLLEITRPPANCISDSEVMPFEPEINAG